MCILHRMTVVNWNIRANIYTLIFDMRFQILYPTIYDSVELWRLKYWNWSSWRSADIWISSYRFDVLRETGMKINVWLKYSKTFSFSMPGFNIRTHTSCRRALIPLRYPCGISNSHIFNISNFALFTMRNITIISTQFNSAIAKYHILQDSLCISAEEQNCICLTTNIVNAVPPFGGGEQTMAQW